MNILTFGEIMLRLSAPDFQRLNQAENLRISYAGSEANVAVSLANFGNNVSFLSKLPHNQLSEKCLRELRGLKVNVDNVILDNGRMGILFIEKGAVFRPSIVTYDRSNSSFAGITPNELNFESILDGVKWLHWSGITPALSLNAYETCKVLLKEARERKITISCDLNYRASLWNYGYSPCEVMTPLVSLCDVIIANEQDCKDIFNIKSYIGDGTKIDIHDKYLKVCSEMKAKFPMNKLIAISLRDSINANYNRWQGAIYDGTDIYFSRQYDITHIVDRVGAGDSFAGALIHGLLHFNDNLKALEFAVGASCLKHTIEGDYNDVSIQEIFNLINGDNTGRIKR